MEVKKKETAAPRQESLGAPYIPEDQLYQNCKSRNVSITVVNPVSGAKVFYSIDGSNPSRALPSNGKLVVSNNFNKKKVPENDQELTIMLKAVMKGVSSDVSTFVVTLHKDYKEWDGYII